MNPVAIIAGLAGAGLLLVATRGRVLAKEGVQLAGLNTDAMLPAIRAANRAAGGVATITSALDGQHMNGSKHFTGEALDFRRVDWPAFNDSEAAAAQADAIAAELGDQYDVLLEQTHVHVEFDPPRAVA